MSKYRRFYYVIFMTLAVLLASVFLFDDKASAISFAPPIYSSFNRDAEVSSSRLMVAQKKKEEREIKSEIAKVSEKKSHLKNEVKSLKAQIKKLDNMFVHINKYAPDSAGNAYAWGNCTYYVKQKRPDIGNFWGNANSWYRNAQIQGWNVGSQPKKGAVATTNNGFYGHVAYVEKVSLDSQWIVISEMNAPILNQVTTRSAHASEFSYIYELN